MRKKILILLACFSTLAATKLYGQQQRYEVGLSAGYTRNSLTTDLGNRSSTRNYPVNGFQVAVPMQYHVNEWFAVQLDLSYIQKNYAIRRTAGFRGVESELKNGFIKAPLMAHFSFGEQDLRGFLNLGGFAEYWINSRIKGTNLDLFTDRITDQDEGSHDVFDFFDLTPFDERVSFDSKRDRRWQLGLLAGVGVEYRVAEKYKVFTEARYYYSVTDLQKNYMINQIPRYNNTIGVQVGVLYGFGGL